MEKYLRGVLLTAAVLVIGCSGSQTLTTDSKNTNALFPGWYQASAFTQDSSSFSSGGTAVASDSLVAIERAETQARILLESHLAQKMEDVRESLNSSEAVKADFIITLRNGHAKAEQAANVINVTSKKTEKGYRGFAVVSISKQQFHNLMEQSFSSKSGYWNILSSSSSYKAIVN